jgi:hypothetical protein
MCALPTVLAEAYAPDADREASDAPDRMPRWLAHIVALLILFLLEHLAAFRRRRYPGLPSWWTPRTDMAPGSTQELAASVRGPFGNAIAQMARQWGIGPGHKDWPEVSRAIVAFGGSLQGLDGRRVPQPWWETPEIVPGMIRFEVATKTTAASLLAQLLTADAPPPAREPALARAEPVWPPALWLQVRARAGTGPPTGPPFVCPTGPPFVCGESSRHVQHCYV